MVRLVDLDPRWYAADGMRIGFTFECPHCLGSGHRLGVAVHQNGLINIPPTEIQALHLGNVWEMSGGQSWDSLTLTPSVDASKQGHWHGFITNGAIV